MSRAWPFSCAQPKKGSSLDVLQRPAKSSGDISHLFPKSEGGAHGTLFTDCSDLARFALSFRGEFSPPLVLLPWQPASALVECHRRPRHWAFLRRHFFNSGLAGASRRFGPSLSLLFLGLRRFYRELRRNSLHGSDY